MTRLAWDAPGERIVELGVDRGVLYPAYMIDSGVAWNGLTGVDETPAGGEPQSFWLDGMKVVNEAGLEEYEATIHAITYPAEFEICNGVTTLDSLSFHQQNRQPFSFSYRTLIANDIEAQDFGYKIHIVYNALATPTQVNYESINDGIDVTPFSWKVTTLPVKVPGLRPVAHVVIDSTKLQPKTLKVIEDYLYGARHTDAKLLWPEALREIVPWTYFEVEDDDVTGIRSLFVSDILDVRPNETPGFYSRTPDSRLVESSTPGLYTLDV